MGIYGPGLHKALCTGQNLPGPLTQEMWVGMLAGVNVKFFNLANSNLRKSYVLRHAAGTRSSDRFAVCLFNCQTLDLISAFDIERSISKFNENLDSYFELRASGFLRTLQEIKPDLSGLTGSKLSSVQNGMQFIARKVRNGNRPRTPHELTGAVIKIN